VEEPSTEVDADKKNTAIMNSDSPKSEVTLEQQEDAMDTALQTTTAAVDKPEVVDSVVDTSVATENSNISESKIDSSKVHKKHKKHKKHKHKKQKEST